MLHYDYSDELVKKMKTTNVLQLLNETEWSYVTELLDLAHMVLYSVDDGCCSDDIFDILDPITDLEVWESWTDNIVTGLRLSLKNSNDPHKIDKELLGVFITLYHWGSKLHGDKFELKIKNCFT